MRTTVGIAPKNRKHIGAREREKRNQQRSPKSSPDTTKVGKSVNGFLTSVFKKRHAASINPLFSSESYDYIYKTAENYARLLGENFTLKADGKNFEAVCNKLDSLLPKGQDLSIRLYVKDHTLQMKLVDSLDYTLLYYIPCKILDQTEGQFRNILLEFFRLLQSQQKLTPLLDSQHFEMWKDEVENYYDNNGEEPDDGWLATFKRYTEGDIFKTLELVDQRPQYDAYSLNTLLDDYMPTTDSKREKKILLLIKKGLNLMKTGKVLLHYTNGPRQSSEDQPVDADNTFMIIYEDDMIVENVIEYMNNYACETGYEFFSSINKTITPKTKKPVQPDKFVLKFLEWINDFSYVLYNG